MSTPPDRGYGYKPPTTKDNPKRPVTPKPGAPASSYMNPAYQTTANRANFDKYGQAGTDMLGQAPVDQWGGYTPAEYFAALMGANGVNAGAGGSGGSGGSGGGSGGRAAPVNPDPLGWNAIAQSEATRKGYEEMLAALDAKNAALMGGYDARNAALVGQRDAGQAQLASLLADLNSRAGAASQAVAGTYGAGDAQLAALQNQYAQMVAGRQAGMGQTLQAFGGTASDAVSNPAGVQDMMMAQRANLARMGQADAALLANRQNVYNGLNSDVTSQRQLAFDSLMAKLLAEKQATQAQGAAERAQLAMQQQQAMLQLAAQEQARKAQYV